MDQEINVELTKIAWLPLGIKLANGHFVGKFYVHAKQLHTMLTDYELMYYEVVELSTKFSALNAKLSGPEKTLFEKVRNMFLLSTTKVMNEKKDKNLLEFDLEAFAGKRIIRWHFSGHRLDGLENYLYVHVTRPILAMFWIVADEFDLNSLEVSGSNNKFDDPFCKPAVRKLYETIAGQQHVVQNSSDTNNEDSDDHGDVGSEGNLDSGVVDSKDVVDRHESDESDSDNLPVTPPPISASEFVDQEKEDEQAQNIPDTPQKKPRLKF